MASKVEDLYEQAMSLDEAERLRLVRLLMETTESDSCCRESRAEIERDWNEEVARRYQEYKDGKVEAIPAEDVFRRLEARYSR